MDRPHLDPRIAAVLRRLASSPRRESFVVRGGVVTAALVAPRPRRIEDLDLLAQVDRFDGVALFGAIAEVLATALDDGVAIGAPTSEVIWAETAFPGLRVRADVEGTPLQVDIGVGDPMHGGPVERALAPGATVWTCRAETMLGWKLHGMFERGPGRWRPKDLHDLDLLLALDLDRDLVVPSITLAFTSRGDSVALAERLIAGELGQSDWSRRKWQRYREAGYEGSDPGELPEVVARVSAALRVYLGR